MDILLDNLITSFPLFYPISAFRLIDYKYIAASSQKRFLIYHLESIIERYRAVGTCYFGDGSDFMLSKTHLPSADRNINYIISDKYQIYLLKRFIVPNVS